MWTFVGGVIYDNGDYHPYTYSHGSGDPTIWDGVEMITYEDLNREIKRPITIIACHAEQSKQLLYENEEISYGFLIPIPGSMGEVQLDEKLYEDLDKKLIPSGAK